MKFGLFIAIATTVVISACSKKDSSTTPAPVANFTYSGAGTAPANVSFSNSSTGATSYLWDFGDNSTSTSTSPTHTYTQGGVYTVKLTATGAGGNHSTTKTVNIATPTSVKITGVKVTQMPFTTPGGGGWDNNSGPDVFYTIEDLNSVLFSSSTYFPNATASSLPIAFSVSPAFQAANFNTTYKVNIWDYDGNDVPSNPDDFIGGYQFSFSAFASSGYPTNAILFVNGNALKIELTLLWQ